MKLNGVFPPLTTPFGRDDEIDCAALKSNIARYNKTHLSGYVLNGSTSESVLLTWNEIERLWTAAREAAAKDKILIAGTGAESTRETIQQTKIAAKLSYQAALVRTPSYYKPAMTFEAEAAHFTAVADASPIPVMIYSVPIFTGYTAEAPLVATLARHPNIIGIKDSSGNTQRIKDILASTPRGFNTLTGSAATLAESLEAGATGAILAISCAAPEACCELYAASRQGDSARIAEIKKQALAPASNIAAKYGIAGLKYAMDQLGYIGGAPRLPLLPVNDDAKQEIASLAAAIASFAAPVAH